MNIFRCSSAIFSLLDLALLHFPYSIVYWRLTILKQLITNEIERNQLGSLPLLPHPIQLR